MYPEVFFPKFWNFEIWPTYAKFSIFAIFCQRPAGHILFCLRCWIGAWGALGRLPRELYLNIFENLSFGLLMASFCCSILLSRKIFFILVLKTNLDTYLPEKSPIYKTSIIWWHPKDPLTKRWLFREKESWRPLWFEMKLPNLLKTQKISL